MTTLSLRAHMAFPRGMPLEGESKHSGVLSSIRTNPIMATQLLWPHLTLIFF